MQSLLLLWLLLLHPLLAFYSAERYVACPNRNYSGFAVFMPGRTAITANGPRYSRLLAIIGHILGFAYARFNRIELPN